MSLKNEALFEKGEVCSIYEETLSDRSHVYNVRVYDQDDQFKYVTVETLSEEHANSIFCAIEVITK